jgi:dTDP-4-dehydrorhamnose reductase
MKKTVIFGGRGQLGVELVREFAARGYHVAAFDRASADITNAAGVERVVAEHKPNLVLNAAAFNQVDLAESEPLKAYEVNALAVMHLAVACRKFGAKFVHFSTDYVFDGISERPWLEEDETHPIGAYAVSKLAGELYARAYLDDVLILRTSGVYGPGGMDTARGNFVELMLRLAGNHQPIRVVEDYVASPSYSPALAARTAELVALDTAGVLHLGGGTPISWFDWARKIFAAAGLNPELTRTNQAQYPTPARRPKFSALSNAKAEGLGMTPMPPLDEALRDYFARRNLKLTATR